MSLEAGVIVDGGWYRFEVKDDQLLLYVLPKSESDENRNFEQLVKISADYGVPSESSSILISAFNEAMGNPVVLSSTEVLESVDGEIIIEIDPTGMECTINVKPAKGIGVAPLIEDVRKALEAHGVISGIDNDLIEDVFNRQRWNEVFVAAKGTPVINGVDGRIEYTFMSEQHVLNVGDDGRVDFYNLNLVHNVQKGDVLAIIYPPIEGSDGTTIFGKQIIPKQGKRIIAPIGRNVELAEEGSKILAGTDGEAILEKKNVSVLQAHTVAGDVDFGSGNIDFTGSVIVQGNITNGFIVKASGNVEVNGAVIGGSIDAAGDVMVRNGIQGQNKGIIKAGGNLFARYIENATVYAAQNVDGGEAIMHSEVNSGGEVSVLNRKGVIVGGVVRAAKVVHCHIVGSEIGVVTVIEIGINPLAREELKNIYKELPSKENDLDKAVKAVSILRQLEKSQNGLTCEKKDMLLNLMKTQYSLIGEVDRLKKRKAELEVELENTKQGKLRSKELIYPGVKLTIGKAIMHIEDTLQRSALVLDAGEIRVTQY